MAITNYSELQTAVADHLDRSDLSSYIPDFIVLSEARFNQTLRHRKMEAIEDLTPSSGVVSLPSDYLEYIRVVDKGSNRRELRSITPHAADQYYGDSPTGTACDFAIVGSSLYTYPQTSNTVELTYYQKIPDLATNTTNWLLTESPGLYLHATLAHAAEFLRDHEKMQVETALSESMLRNLISTNTLSKHARTSYMSGMVTP
jgi:hypothetical protein